MYNNRYNEPLYLTSVFLYHNNNLQKKGYYYQAKINIQPDYLFRATRMHSIGTIFYHSYFIFRRKNKELENVQHLKLLNG